MGAGHDPVDEPANRRLERIRRAILLDRQLTLDDAEFLLARHDEAVQGLHVQQERMNEATEHWRKLGYEQGYEDGYKEAT